MLIVQLFGHWVFFCTIWCLETFLFTIKYKFAITNSLLINQLLMVIMVFILITILKYDKCNNLQFCINYVQGCPYFLFKKIIIIILKFSLI